MDKENYSANLINPEKMRDINEDIVEKNNIEHTTIIYDKRLYQDGQKMKAIELCSRCEPLTLIHGPPGTGKTTTLAAAVLSAVANGEKVLVVAPSHAACDAFTLALAKQWPRSIEKSFVRLGNSLRFTSEDVALYSTDKISPSAKLEDLQDQLFHVRNQLLDNSCKGKGSVMLEEKYLTREYWTEGKENEKKVIKSSSVVITTIMHATSLIKYFKEKEFDLFVIDEAGFTPASSTLPLISWAPRLLLAGDHHQLPPVVLTQEAKLLGLDISLFEMLAGKMKDQICMLETQYRSHNMIAGWSSQHFYKNRLVSADIVSKILVQDLIKLSNKRGNILTASPLLLLDTSGLDWTEEAEDEESISNPDEAVLVAELVEKYLQMGVLQSDIGVIAPYWSQISLIRSNIGN
ncbi:DNA-binding protein SMUBP-2 [Eurytemora carolleeae]|uniref:DNA-binding protein SMUBP-2 n=1 Tax=Eurytemora carolleeae TaxID=1294199 RepID=UPI000C782DCE|nr:DNA-binding protein SMUBP-2 [Eurytemora carolleeae]|eukprot:XP_023341127.1 DNA-binding protein SMUBP-2-like [Eurytemora affinis]